MAFTIFTGAQQTCLDRKKPKNYYLARKLYERGGCALCVDNGLNHDENIIIHATTHWVIWQAPSSRRPDAHQNGLEHHLMLVPKRCFSGLFEMKWYEWINLWKMLGWIKKEFTLKSFFFFSRSGDPLPNGATELHFCFQIKVADRSDPERKRMVEVFSKTDAEEMANVDRGKRFGEIYEEWMTLDQFMQAVKDDAV